MAEKRKKAKKQQYPKVSCRTYDLIRVEHILEVPEGKGIKIEMTGSLRDWINARDYYYVWREFLYEDLSPLFNLAVSVKYKNRRRSAKRRVLSDVIKVVSALVYAYFRINKKAEDAKEITLKHIEKVFSELSSHYNIGKFSFIDLDSFLHHYIREGERIINKKPEDAKGLISLADDILTELIKRHIKNDKDLKEIPEYKLVYDIVRSVLFDETIKYIKELKFIQDAIFKRFPALID